MTKLYWSNRKTHTLALNIPKSIQDAMLWSAGDYITIEVLGRDKLKLEKIRVVV